MQDMVDVLRGQHLTIRALLDEAARHEGRRRLDALADLHREVQIQFLVERSIVHPAYREHVHTDQTRAVVEAAEERQELVDDAFFASRRLEPASHEHRFKVATLREAIEGHLDGQERMVAAFRAACTERTLRRLARPLVVRRQALEQSRQGTAHSPAW